MFACEICGTEFERPKGSRRRTCSGACRAELSKKTRDDNKRAFEGPPRRRWSNPHARGVKGIRDDLHGIYMRSRWEANVARFLDVLVMCGHIERWEYEPQVFHFPVKRGNKTYTPDFLVHPVGGDHYWLEVKGWMDKPSRIKIKRFGIHFPKERLVIVDEKAYRELEKQFADVIPNWEKKPSASSN